MAPRQPRHWRGKGTPTLDFLNKTVRNLNYFLENQQGFIKIVRYIFLLNKTLGSTLVNKKNLYWDSFALIGPTWLKPELVGIH